MDRTVVTHVDPASTTPSVTTSTVAVYRGVVLGTREISVLKVKSTKHAKCSYDKFIRLFDNLQIALMLHANHHYRMPLR